MFQSCQGVIKALGPDIFNLIKSICGYCEEFRFQSARLCLWPTFPSFLYSVLYFDFFPGYVLCFSYPPNPLSSSISLQVIPSSNRKLKVTLHPPFSFTPCMQTTAAAGGSIPEVRPGSGDSRLWVPCPILQRKSPETQRVEAMHMRTFKVKVAETRSKPLSLWPQSGILYIHLSLSMS